MTAPIRIFSVPYENARPYHVAIETAYGTRAIIEKLAPSNMVAAWRQAASDFALMPVAALPEIEDYQIVPELGIGCHGVVHSVGVFSKIPFDDLSHVALHPTSRSSNALLGLLCQHHWPNPPQLMPAGIADSSTTGRLVIGDQALVMNEEEGWIYEDLGQAWLDYSGLGLAFAVWIHRQNLPKAQVNEFRRFMAAAAGDPTACLRPDDPPYLRPYLGNYIHYQFSQAIQDGMMLFLAMIENQQRRG